VAYSVGGIIDAADYNGFATTLNPGWGAGSSTSGYGQTSLIATNLAAGQTVTEAQWDDLIDKINRMSAHQTGSNALTAGSFAASSALPTATSAASGLIAYSGSLQSSIAAVMGTQRLNAASSGSSISSSGSRAGSASSWSQSASFSFGSTDQARWFFNAGGVLKVQVSFSGGRDQNWSSICSAMGTLYVNGTSGQTIAGTSYNGSGKVGGGGTGGCGYFQGGGQLYSGTGSGRYSSNRLTVSVSGNGGSSITFSFSFVDGHTPFNGWSQDAVSGSTTVTAVAQMPSTSWLSASWGSPSISVS